MTLYAKLSLQADSTQLRDISRSYNLIRSILNQRRPHGGLHNVIDKGENAYRGHIMDLSVLPCPSQVY